jgi:hypothetical protein
MKKLLFVLTAAVFLSIPVAPEASAGGGFDYTWNYYTDATFSSAVGWYEELCDNSIDGAGTYTDYRLEEQTSCANGHESYNCQIWNSTTHMWDYVECPGPTMSGRLRIPVGRS